MCVYVSDFSHTYAVESITTKSRMLVFFFFFKFLIHSHSLARITRISLRGSAHISSRGGPFAQYSTLYPQNVTHRFLRRSSIVCYNRRGARACNNDRYCSWVVFEVSATDIARNNAVRGEFHARRPMRSRGEKTRATHTKARRRRL